MMTAEAALAGIYETPVSDFRVFLLTPPMRRALGLARRTVTVAIRGRVRSRAPRRRRTAAARSSARSGDSPGEEPSRAAARAAA